MTTPPHRGTPVPRPTRASTALVVAALVVLGLGPVAVVTSSEVAAQGCGPAPAGRVAVAVVVDDGTGVSERCVEVDERTDGYTVLRAAGHQLRIEAGFLCGIDGYPATGCGNRPGFDGSYWRYYHGAPGGGWTYSSVGGGGYRMPARCAIEGWRWTSVDSTSTPPRTPPPPIVCEAPRVTAPPTLPPPPPAAVPPSPAPAPGAPPGGAAPAPDATDGAPGAAGPTATAPIDGTAGGVPGADDAAGEPDTENSSGAADPTSEADGVDGAAGDTSDADERDADGSDADERAVDSRTASARSASDAGSGSPVGVVLAVIVVAALGGGAYWRTRRATPGNAGESVEGP